MTEPQTHMARETAEAPDVVARMLSSNRDALKEIGRLYRVRKPSHIVTCARGSSDHAATYFKYLTEITLGLPCCSVGASVVSIYGARLALRDTLLVTISQSGKSPDILAFQAEAKRAGVPTLAITNDEASPLAADADLCLPLRAGVEQSVAATKTFIASAVITAAIVAESAGDGALLHALDKLPVDLARANKLHWTEARRSGSRNQPRSMSSAAAPRCRWRPRPRSSSRKLAASMPKPIPPPKCCMVRWRSSARISPSSSSRRTMPPLRRRTRR